MEKVEFSVKGFEFKGLDTVSFRIKLADGNYLNVNPQEVYNLTLEEVELCKLEATHRGTVLTEFPIRFSTQDTFELKKPSDKGHVVLGFRFPELEFSSFYDYKESRELRNHLRKSESERIGLLEKLSKTNEYFQKEIHKFQENLLKNNGETKLGIIEQYDLLEQKYTAALQNFSKKEDYLQNKLLEVSNQKQDLMVSVQTLEHEKRSLESKLKATKETLDFERSKNSPLMPYKELLNTTQTALEEQNQLYKETLKQLQLTQSRNASLNSRVSYLESLEVRNQDQEDSFRFSFGNTQETLETLVHNCAQKLNLKTESCESSLFHIGPLKVEVKLEEGKLLAVEGSHCFALEKYLQDKLASPLESTPPLHRKRGSLQVKNFIQKTPPSLSSTKNYRGYTPILKKKHQTSRLNLSFSP